MLIHGIPARTSNSHLLAKGVAWAGSTVSPLDIRVHGEPGPRGQIIYTGQFEDEVEDFLEVLARGAGRIIGRWGLCLALCH